MQKAEALALILLWQGRAKSRTDELGAGVAWRQLCLRVFLVGQM